MLHWRSGSSSNTSVQALRSVKLSRIRDFTAQEKSITSDVISLTFCDDSSNKFCIPSVINQHGDPSVSWKIWNNRGVIQIWSAVAKFTAIHNDRSRKLDVRSWYVILGLGGSDTDYQLSANCSMSQVRQPLPVAVRFYVGEHAPWPIGTDPLHSRRSAPRPTDSDLHILSNFDFSNRGPQTAQGKTHPVAFRVSGNIS